jgi:large subunit ribosomal protein L16
MMQPKRMKFRKAFRGRTKGSAGRGAELAFGEYGLKTMDRGWLTSRQIEAARKAIAHHTKRLGKMWIRIFPDKPVTAKEAGQGMGSGKGDVKQYVAVVVPGKILFELSGVTKETASQAMKLAKDKLPFKCKFIDRDME